MTQEELDMLMETGFEESDLSGTQSVTEQAAEAPVKKEKREYKKPEDYRLSADSEWPPPPPTDDHKIVHQLDEVTQDSEEKASAVFDALDSICVTTDSTSASFGEIAKNMDEIRVIFAKLNEKFPEVGSFQGGLAKCDHVTASLANAGNGLDAITDHAMSAMNIMQYQDIHRQKIERVINVMRMLARYMNLLFEGKKEDEKRVGSAVHLHGDETTDLADAEDIEALIASFGK